MWFDVLDADELKPGGQKCVLAAGVKVLLVKEGDEIFALENQCTHAAFPLEGGLVSGGVLRCPMHGARFSLATGESSVPGRIPAVDTYPVEIRNGRVNIEVITEQSQRAVSRICTQFSLANTGRNRGFKR